MDEPTVRERAETFGDALVAGNIDAAIGSFSDELRRNVGEVLSLLPVPVSEALIESIDRGASAFVVVLRLASGSDEVRIQTRWKDREGGPRIVEVSHLSRTEREAEREAESWPAEAGEREDATAPT